MSSLKLMSNFKPDSKEIWNEIKREYDVTKVGFGKRFGFIKEKFDKSVIYRDVEHAYFLAKNGFAKPAVILAGGVIEELLRRYLIYKKITPSKENFDGYIKTCKAEGLLGSAISSLSDSIRHHRNLVHLSSEKERKDTVSKATAMGAVSSIFTITNDFV